MFMLSLSDSITAMLTCEPHPTEASALNWRRACFILAGVLLSACAAAPQVSDKPLSHFNDRAAVESPLVTRPNFLCVSDVVPLYN